MASTYEQAWLEYREALDRLYERDGSVGVERSERSVSPAADVEERADAVVARSEQLGAAAESGLESDDLGVRELAELQLVAAAALDLLTATDLAEAGDGTTGSTERSAGTSRAELFEILEAPQEAGIAAILPATREADRGGRGDARGGVVTAADDALEDIIDDAGAAAAALTTGLLEIPGLPFQDAAAAMAHELLERLGEGVKGLLSKAVALVEKAIEKLGKALGRAVRDTAARDAADWLARLREGELIGALLSWLYEPDRVRAEVRAQLDATGADDAALRAVARRLEELAGRFGKQRKAIEWLARGLAAIRGWLLGLQPWGPVALVSAHTLGLGYVTYMGGDFVDWYRGRERLDVVEGVRAIVRGGAPPKT